MREVSKFRCGRPCLILDQLKQASLLGQKLNALVMIINHLLVQVCQVVQPLLSHTLDVIVLILSRWSDVL